MLGKYAQDKGYKKAFLLAPNYQAGKDMIGGFKKHFKGEIADEVYTPLGQLDFSAELAKIAAAKPDAFFVFMPGGMGVNLVKQYRQAGLDSIPFLSVFTVDEFDAAGAAGRGRRLLLRHDLGAQHRHARRTRSSSPTSRRSTATCPAATPCRPTTPPRSSTAR